MASIMRTIVTLYLFISIVEFTTAPSLTSITMENLTLDLMLKGLYDVNQGHWILQFQGVAIEGNSQDYGSATKENLNTIRDFRLRLQRQEPQQDGGVVNYIFKMTIPRPYEHDAFFFSLYKGANDQTPQQYTLNRGQSDFWLPFNETSGNVFSVELIPLDDTNSIGIIATDQVGSQQVKKAFIFGTECTVSGSAKDALEQIGLNKVYWKRSSRGCTIS